MRVCAEQHDGDRSACDPSRRRGGTPNFLQRDPRSIYSRDVSGSTVAEGAPSGGEDLVERQRELERLRGLRDGMRGGAGRVVIIEGPAGIGKTRLLAATRALAGGDHWTVLAARGGQHERESPFAAVRELLEPVVAGASPGERSELLAGAARHAEPVFAAPAGRAPGDRSFTVLHGLYWLLANLALRRPVLLAVDDAHWIDAESARWLAYLATRVEELEVLLALTVRSGDVRPAAIVEIAARAETTVIAPEALTEAGVERVVRRRQGASDDDAVRLAKVCHRLTRGNPLLLRTLLLSLQDDRATAARLEQLEPLTLERVGQVVLPRIGRLGPAAVQVTQAVAVLGDGAELRIAARTVGLASEAAAHAADALRNADVLASERRLTFTHPIVREAVYSDLPGGRRSQLHRAAAEVLADDSTIEHAARHLLAVEPNGSAETVDVLRRAAREALARGASQTALAFHRRALSEPPPPAQRADVLLEAGAAAVAAADPEGSTWLRQALGTASPDRIAGASAELATFAMLTGPNPEVVGALERTLDRLRDAREPLLRIHASLAAAGALHLQLRAVAAEHARALRALAPRGDTPGERVALAVLAFESLRSEDPADVAAEFALRAHRSGDLLDDLGAGSPLFLLSLASLMYADRLIEAVAVCDAALQRARDHGSPITFALASGLRAMSLARIGHLRDAEADLAAAREVVPQEFAIVLEVGALTTQVQLLREQGRLQDAAALLGPVDRDVEGNSTMLGALGELRLAQGRPREALDDLLACGRYQDAWGFRSPRMIPWRTSAALAHHALGDRERALELAGDEVAAARQFKAGGPLGGALRALGLVTGGDDGIDLLRAAVNTLAGSPARLEHARGLIRRYGRAWKSRRAATLSRSPSARNSSSRRPAPVRAG
jgi:tetratricopeptide (TPR) repeat protein